MDPSRAVWESTLAGILERVHNSVSIHLSVPMQLTAGRQHSIWRVKIDCVFNVTVFQECCHSALEWGSAASGKGSTL